MKQRYLEVTFRRGKPFAAYLYLPRAPATKAARTTDAGHGLRVDYDKAGTPIGIEITAPRAITVSDLNEVRARLGLSPVPVDEWAPLRAA
ncbi:MAG TPA: DUF2283 domain-containing protein [Polyangiales bacterium]|nr:DUF2283 domain-containing protein [Polyangiales bacterium]